MVKHRRLGMIVASTILFVFCEGSVVWWLKDNCPALPLAECRLLWGAAFASTAGGALFLEILLARKQVRGEWQVRAQDLRSEGPVLSSSQVWIRSIARVVLASLLVGFPVVIRGALGIAIIGAFAGLSINGLVRAITNRLPPIEEDTETKRQD